MTDFEKSEELLCSPVSCLTKMGFLEGQFKGVVEDVAQLKEDMRAVRTTLDEAHGSWKMLLFLGSVSAAIGSIVTFFLGKH